MKRARWFIGVVVAIAMFVVMLVTAIEIAVYYNGDFFEKEFEKYNVEENTLVDMPSLLYVKNEMLDYLKGDRNDLNILVTVRNEQVDFFSDRAKEHMVDVRNLFLIGISVRTVGLALMLVGIIVLISTKSECWKVLSKCFNIVSAVVAVATLVLGVLIAIDFSTAFTKFHHMFFKNDLWLLEEDDRLLNMVPEGFFIDVTIRITIVFVCFFVAMLSLSILYRTLLQKVVIETNESQYAQIVKDCQKEKEEFLSSVEDGSVDYSMIAKEEREMEEACKKLRQDQRFRMNAVLMAEEREVEVAQYEKEKVARNAFGTVESHSKVQAEQPVEIKKDIKERAKEEPNEQANEQANEKDTYVDAIYGDMPDNEAQYAALAQLQATIHEMEEEVTEQSEETEVQVTEEVIEQSEETETVEETEVQVAEEVTEQSEETEVQVAEEVTEQSEETEVQDAKEAAEQSEEDETVEEATEEVIEQSEETEVQIVEEVSEQPEETEAQVTEETEEFYDEEDLQGEVVENYTSYMDDFELESPAQSVMEETFVETETLEAKEEEETEEAEKPEEAEEAEETEEAEEAEEIEVIHINDAEVIEDSHLEIAGIALEKEMLERERLRKQYGIPYEEITPEEERSIEERMQKLMEEYHVIQP